MTENADVTCDVRPWCLRVTPLRQVFVQTRLRGAALLDSAELTTKCREAIRNTLKWGWGRGEALDGQGRIKFLVIAQSHF